MIKAKIKKTTGLLLWKNSRDDSSKSDVFNDSENKNNSTDKKGTSIDSDNNRDISDYSNIYNSGIRDNMKMLFQAITRYRSLTRMGSFQITAGITLNNFPVFFLFCKKVQRHVFFGETR